MLETLTTESVKEEDTANKYTPLFFLCATAAVEKTNIKAKAVNNFNSFISSFMFDTNINKKAGIKIDTSSYISQIIRLVKLTQV